MTGVAASRFNVTFANRQRARRINPRALRPLVETLLGELLELRAANLAVSFVAASDMTRLNETFLHHAGSTDVITFDYSERGTRNAKLGTDLHGEIVVCVDEANLQARRFRTTWQAEIVRYVVHGVLHLLGHDDRRAAARRRMKRVENRLFRSLGGRFGLRKLALASPRRRARNS
jgi:probable rRNA maturation factor